MSPPPRPVPTVNIMTVSKFFPAPNFFSPHAAEFASFSNTTFRPMSSSSWSVKRIPFHPAMLGVASIVLRSDEIKPAAETPTASTSNSCIKSCATSAIVFVSAAPPSRGVSRRAVFTIEPLSSTTPPKTLVPPTSMPRAKLI